MIGLNDFEEEGKWVWSSGEEVDFTKWSDGIRNGTYQNVAVINSARSLSGVKNNNFGTWQTIRNDDWRYRECMMILELPGIYTQEQLDEAEYIIVPQITNKATNLQLKNNALLIPTWDPEVRNLMKFEASWMDRGYWASIANNYWGGGTYGISDHVIAAMIIDFEENFNVGKVVFEPKLQAAPENAYPHVVDIKLSTASGSINEVSLLQLSLIHI